MNNILYNEDVSFSDSHLFSDIDKTLSFEEYVETLKNLVSPILTQVFKDNYAKQNIRVFRNRINIACPYCHDSKQDNHKKRGNIILTGKHKNFYKCFNCNEFKRIDNFFKDFHVILDLDVVNYIASNIQDFQNNISSDYNISILLNESLINSHAINRELLKEKLNLIEVKGSKIWNYLVNRLQYDESKFLYSEKDNYILILNLNKEGNIIGAQKRLMIESKDKFRTYTLSFLHELIGNKDIKIPEEIDTISTLFNICFLNINKPVTLFEGPMDCFLFHNSCANAGAQKHFPIEGLNIRYFFDDDTTGRKKAFEFIDKENYVFLWTKFKLDNGIPFNKLKYDLNDVLIWAKKNNVKLTRFDNYFSSDPLDSIDI
jgi:hypothetical protein